MQSRRIYAPPPAPFPFPRSYAVPEHPHLSAYLQSFLWDVPNPLRAGANHGTLILVMIPFFASIPCENPFF